MNSLNLSEANNKNSTDSTKKRDEKFPNVSEMEHIGSQDGVDTGAMLSASTLHQYVNMGCNNISQYHLINGKISP